MARPQDADSRITYERVVAAASKLIQKIGVDKLSLRAVADEAGVGLGTINYYFSNKDGLLEACLEEGYRWVEEQAAAAVARIIAGEDGQLVVAQLTRAMFQRGRTERELIRLRLFTTMRTGALPEQRLRGELLHTMDRVFAAFSEAKQTKLRFAIHSFELLVGRYAAHTDEELCRISGHTDLDTALEAVERHLVDVAIDLFRNAGIPALG